MNGLYQIFNQDCIEGMANHLDPDSIHLIVTSIPYGALFMYSGKNQDIGNNPDGVDLRGSQFGLHMRFAIDQMYRVLKPGCNCCIEIIQLVSTKVQHGFMGRRDLRGAVVDLWCAAGFEWKSEICIKLNPQAIAQRLKLHSLLFETGKNNARNLAPVYNKYVMIFQKPGNSEPVRAIYHRQDNPSGWVTTDNWIAWAAGVWTDIQETDVLDGYKSARENDEEKHVAPMQLEIVRRLVKLYTNPGEVVLDPFSGIGSTGYVAIEQGRRYIGCELKESYYQQSLRNLEKARKARDAQRGDLFTWAGIDVGALPEAAGG